MGIRNEHKGRRMTREEAIQALKKEKRTALHENKVAFDMAIKALEQEPVTKNDLGIDSISREDALMCLTGKFEIRGYEPSELISIFSKRIKALPSVTPIRPKGHWIGQKKIGFGEWKECIVPLKDGYVTDSCSCSECGEWLTGSDEYQCSGNFYPACGADMRGDAE